MSKEVEPFKSEDRFRLERTVNDGWIVTTDPGVERGYVPDTLYAFSNAHDLLQFLVTQLRVNTASLRDGSVQNEGDQA